MWKAIKDLWGLWLMLAVSVAVGLVMTPKQWEKRPNEMKQYESIRERQKKAEEERAKGEAGRR